MHRLRKKIISKVITLFTVLVVLAWLFPVFYTFLTGFKTEESVVPPSLIIKHFTLQNYRDVLSTDIIDFFINSLLITVFSVIFGLFLGVPISYRIVFTEMKNPDKLFFWLLTTFVLPPVAVLVPALLLLKFLGLLDTVLGLVIVYTGTHVPIIVWLVTSFFHDIPREILEAAYIDGSGRLYSFLKIILPLSKIGIVSSGLLVFVFIWNEFFFAINLTGSRANTLPVYMSTFLTQEGLFWAKLSAIASLVIIPTIIFGMMAQKSLIKGLTAGSVKG